MSQCALCGNLPPGHPIKEQAHLHSKQNGYDDNEK